MCTSLCICKIWYNYKMECILTVKNKDIMKFAGQRIELENIILDEISQTKNNMQRMYILISEY